MPLTKQERAAIAVQLDDLRQQIDQLVATTRHRITLVADAIREHPGCAEPSSPEH